MWLINDILVSPIDKNVTRVTVELPSCHPLVSFRNVAPDVWGCLLSWKFHKSNIFHLACSFWVTRVGPCQHGLLCGCKALCTWTDRPRGATSWRVFAADRLVCGPRAGDLARQLATWAGWKCIKLIWYSWLARARFYCLQAACSCRAALVKITKPMI